MMTTLYTKDVRSPEAVKAREERDRKVAEDVRNSPHMRLSDIGKRHGIPTTTVHRILLRSGFGLRNRGRPPTVSPEDAVEMAAKRRKGATLRDIAREYDIPVWAVTAALKRGAGGKKIKQA